MAAKHKTIEQLLPLTPVVYYILLALNEEGRHGYGIITDIAQRTNGDVTLRTGTLYTALQRLVKGGFVEEVDNRPDPELDDQRRRYYRTSDQGRALLRAEVRRLQQMVEIAGEKRLLPDHKVES